MSAEDVIRNLNRLSEELRGPAVEAMLAAAATEAEKHVKVNAHAEFYEGDLTAGGHPRHVTGNLINSIQTASKPDQSAVYVGAEYGAYLEMGTSRGIRPRHYVYRGVAEHLPAIADAAADRGRRILGT